MSIGFKIYLVLEILTIILQGEFNFSPLSILLVMNTLFILRQMIYDLEILYNDSFKWKGAYYIPSFRRYCDMSSFGAIFRVTK